MILQRAGDNLRRRRRVPVHQHHNGKGLSSAAVRRRVHLVGIRASPLRHNHLPLGEQMVAYLHRLAQQAAGIAAQVEDQSLQVAESADRIDHFLARRLLELRQMDIADSRLDLKRQIHGRVRNLVAYQVKYQRLHLPFAHHRHLHVRALGPFQRLRHGVRGHPLRRLAVDCRDHVARPDARLVRRRPLIRRNHIDLVALLLDDHAHAVIMAALVFLHPGIGLRIVEVRVRVQYAQHPRNRPVVDRPIRLVAVQRLGIVLLDQCVYIAEILQVIADLALVFRRLGPHLALHHTAHNGANTEENNEEKDCAAGARGHR